MRTQDSQDSPLAQRPRTDLGGISSKNLLDRLVKLMQKLAKSVTKTSSKVREPKTYNKAVNNSINRNR